MADTIGPDTPTYFWDKFFGSGGDDSTAELTKETPPIAALASSGAATSPRKETDPMSKSTLEMMNHEMWTTVLEDEVEC